MKFFKPYYVKDNTSYILLIMQVNIKLLFVPGIIILLIFFILLLRPKNRNQRLHVKLVDKNKLTHDTIIFTFILPHPHRSLGLKIGQHIQVQAIINGELVKRKYTPISRVDRIGSFELLLKIYHKNEQFPDGGKMSSYLQGLPTGQKVIVTLPYGKFNYEGKSSTKITSYEKEVKKKKYKNFYMVAGGTGITPIYQIIQFICETQTEGECPNLILLFANRTQEDILLQDSIIAYQKVNPKLKCYFSVDRSITQEWKGFVGFVNEDKIKETLPDNLEQTLFMSCGPPILSNIVQKIWVSMKIPIDRIYRF